MLTAHCGKPRPSPVHNFKHPSAEQPNVGDFSEEGLAQRLADNAAKRIYTTIIGAGGGGCRCRCFHR